MPAFLPAADSPDALPARRLEEVIALGDEAAAFAAAGLPLEVGLGAGRPRGLSERIARRLRDGMSLPDAYAEERGPAPAAMRAVLESGVRSGRPGEALARVAERSRMVSELRAELGAALIGPLAVIGAAAALAAWFLPLAAGPLANILRQAGAEVSGSVRLFERMGQDGSAWLWLAPAAAVAAAVLLAWLTGGRLLGWLPGVRRVRNELRWSSCAHLLSLLTDAGTPLGEALRLSAGSAGGAGPKRFAAAADRLDAGENRADVFFEGAASPAPPLLSWTLATVPAADLPTALAEVAATHA
ncbi:type II secretion system F family protein, partial [Alienimonas chondri]|uniref:type II secretion system F family protein n=1 Tax=Alienimonas chondri TaxID=2681879 RepID=UPI0014876B9C